MSYNQAVCIQPQALEKEFKCVKCQAYPISPRECHSCDAIKCSDCVKEDEGMCQSNCSHPLYNHLKPKTRLLFESVMIQCKYCPNSYSALKITQHEDDCAEKSQSRDDLTLRTTGNPYTVPLLAHYTPKHRLAGILIGLISSIFMLITLHYAIRLLFIKENLTFHLVCTGQFTGSEGICLFAFGQFAVGIITIAQIGVGFITISQIGIGLLFGIGQVTSGVGFSVGQIVSSVYVFRAQFGIAFYKIVRARLGVQSLYSLINKKSPFVMNWCLRKKRPIRT